MDMEEAPTVVSPLGEGEPIDAAAADQAPKPPNRLRSLWRSGRAVWVLTLVGVVGLVVGYVLGGVVLSPDQAQVPPAVEGLITAKVEARQITATVVTRADVTFADRVPVNPPSPDGAVAPVVTGQVPAVGAQMNAGDVVLEVSGRPVFVLRGDFPSYRSLSAGSNGADVVQLRKALNELGLSAGAESATYDEALASAVRQLYKRAGYAAPDGGDQADQAVRTAEDGVTDAKDGVDQASSGVTQAQKAFDRAKEAETQARSDYEQAPDPVTQAQAKVALEQAKVGVEQAGLGVEQAKTALAAAQRGVSRAQETLTDARRAAWATVPVGAAVFVPDLPRRVDEVHVAIGDDLTKLQGQTGAGASAGGGAVATVAPVVLSGAQVVVTAMVDEKEAALLSVGGSAVLTAGGGVTVTGSIGSICQAGADKADKTARCPVEVVLTDLGGVSPAELVGNVQVTMTVGKSSPSSVIVPVAAVSADTVGHARVTVVEGRLEAGVAARDQKTTITEVETGLSAEGMVEITRATPALTAGDLVVIGQGSGQAPDPSSPPPTGR